MVIFIGSFLLQPSQTSKPLLMRDRLGNCSLVRIEALMIHVTKMDPEDCAFEQVEQTYKFATDDDARACAAARIDVQLNCLSVTAPTRAGGTDE